MLDSSVGMVFSFLQRRACEALYAPNMRLTSTEHVESTLQVSAQRNLGFRLEKSQCTYRTSRKYNEQTYFDGTWHISGAKSYIGYRESNKTRQGNTRDDNKNSGGSGDGQSDRSRPFAAETPGQSEILGLTKYISQYDDKHRSDL